MESRKSFRRFIGVVAFLVVPCLATAQGPLFRQQAASESDFVVKGFTTGSLTGFSVAPLGDVNGDRLPDMIVGAPGANRAFVVLGRPGGGRILDPAGAGTIVIQNDLPGNRFGWSVASAGDFNGDGLKDILIGWPGASFTGINKGAAVLIPGRDIWSHEAPARVLLLSALSNAGGLLLRGQNSGDLAGVSVAGGGDFNGDQLDDIVIAAPKTRAEFYVVFGTPTIPPVLDLVALDQAGFSIQTTNGDVPVGTSSTICAWPGDVNRDGFGDLLLGTPTFGGALQPGSGAAWLLFGRPQHPGVLRLSDIPLSGGGVQIRADSPLAFGAHVGHSVAGVGDINRDGFADFAVGAPDARWAGTGGLVTVILGTAQPPTVIDLIQGDFLGFSIVDDLGQPGHRFGASIAAAGDPNNDGYPDLLIGAPQWPDQTNAPWPAGHAYVFYSQEKPGPIDLSKADARAIDLVGVFGARQTGESGDLFGWSVCGAGDWDQDGIDDVIVGSPLSRPRIAGAPAGNVFGFHFKAPRLIDVVLGDANNNQQVDPGERLNITVDHPVRVTTGPAEGLFFLANSGRLGKQAVLLQEQPGSNRFQIALGQDAAGIIVAGPETALDFSASGTFNRVISARQGVNAEDAGAPHANDTGVDIRFPILAASGFVRAATGGAISVAASVDARSGRHRIEFPPGSLAADATVEITNMPDTPGDSGFGTAARLNVSESFSVAWLTIGYTHADIPPGLSEGQMRCVWRRLDSTTGTWTLLPGAQTVDPASNTITVEIRSSILPGLQPARNAFGYSGGFAGIPIETVDEKAISMRPSPEGLPAAKATIELTRSPGKQATVALAPGINSVYPKHQIVFRDMATSSPGTRRVTIRSATIAERTALTPIIGSQYFPDLGDAVFTIETADAGGAPIALTTPVDLAIEYKRGGNPNGVSDVMGLDGAAGPEPNLRIVRSIQDPNRLVPDFAFIAGTQQVDTAATVVRISNFSGLTDAQGEATYGVVVDRSLPDPGSTAARNWWAY